MTAPVTQSAALVKLEMTAPAAQTAAPGGSRVQLVLPRSVTLASAPEPLDPRVRLREVAGQHVAVIRYSGFWSQTNDTEYLEKLQGFLSEAQMAWDGERCPATTRPSCPGSCGATRPG